MAKVHGTVKRAKRLNFEEEKLIVKLFVQFLTSKLLLYRLVYWEDKVNLCLQKLFTESLTIIVRAEV